MMLPAAAFGADLDFGALRGTSYGPERVADWSGPYVGGFAGYSQANFGSKNATSDLLANYFRDTTVENEFGVSSWLQLKSKDARDTSFGGFVGYNFQYDDVVLGFEADYSSTKLRGTSFDSIGRSMTTSDGYANTVRLSGTGRTQLGDYGTIRARAGYVVGSFMPFVTGGLALGDLKTTTSASAQYAGYNVAQNTAYLAGLADGGTPAPFPSTFGYTSFNPAAGTGALAQAQTLSKSKSTVAVGFTAGAGLEVMVTQNIFLRGEYQYAYFDDFNGHKTNLNVARAGGGLKF
jgi:opacity protein-like surface antigen